MPALCCLLHHEASSSESGRARHLGRSCRARKYGRGMRQSNRILRSLWHLRLLPFLSLEKALDNRAVIGFFAFGRAMLALERHFLIICGT